MVLINEKRTINAFNHIRSINLKYCICYSSPSWLLVFCTHICNLCICGFYIIISFIHFIALLFTQPTFSSHSCTHFSRHTALPFSPKSHILNRFLLNRYVCTYVFKRFLSNSLNALPPPTAFYV